jgi:serine/threonine protein kinase
MLFVSGMARNDTEEDPLPSQGEGRLRRGQPVGAHYVILRFLARGGFGEVYVATCPQQPSQLYAIKVLRPEMDTADRQAALLREARTLRALPKHRAFVQVFDGFFDPSIGTAVLVMELVIGRTLRSVLDDHERAFRPDDVVAAGVALGEALAELHDRGFIHADVAPKNIFLTSTVRPLRAADIRLIDVGGAISATLVEADRNVGTEGYLAPERRSGRATPASDVFSLGVILYEMLTRERPVVGAAPRPLRDFVPALAEHVERAILSMIHVDPALRPASGRHVIEALSETAPVASGVPTQALPILPVFVVRDQLLVLDPPDLRGRTFVLDRPQLILGSSAKSADIVVEHESISGRHCVITSVMIDGVYEFRDLDSDTGSGPYGYRSKHFICRRGLRFEAGDVVFRIVALGE